MESQTNTAYEYHDGTVYAIAKETQNHSKLNSNIFAAIQRADLDHEIITYDYRLCIQKKNTFVYPDIMVLNGEKVVEEESFSVTNPILIVEVTSKQTEAYDRGDKFYLYRQIPSFQEYVLIDSERRIVDVFFRERESDLWKISRYQEKDERILLSTLNIKISMKELYDNLSF